MTPCILWAQAHPRRTNAKPGSDSVIQANQSPPAAPSAQTTPPEPPLEDVLGRTTPYGCVFGFLHAAESKNYESAAEYFDGKMSPDQSEEIAVQLKYLLDQGLSTSIEDLSRSPNGKTNDQLRLSREQVGIVKTPNGELKIMLDLVKRPDQPPIWLFSQETLNLVPAAYSSIHHTDYENLFPAWTTSIRILSVPIWRWALIFMTVVLTFALATLFTRITLRLLQSIIRTRLSSGIEQSVLALKAPIFVLILAFLDRAAGGYALTVLGRHYWNTVGFVLALHQRRMAARANHRHPHRHHPSSVARSVTSGASHLRHLAGQTLQDPSRHHPYHCTTYACRRKRICLSRRLGNRRNRFGPRSAKDTR